MAEKAVIKTKEDLLKVKNQTKNIIFDFGGVLFDIDYHLPVVEFQKLGLDNFDEVYKQASQNDIFDQLETGAINQSDFIVAIQDYFKKDVSSQSILNAWNSILLGISKEPISRVVELRQSHRTFIISNTNVIHVEAFEKMIEEKIGLEYFRTAFEKVYYSNVIGLKKPDPNTFLSVCKWNGLIPEETLFIDDTLQHTEGALEAGLMACHLDLSKTNMLELFASW